LQPVSVDCHLGLLLCTASVAPTKVVLDGPRVPPRNGRGAPPSPSPWPGARLEVDVAEEELSVGAVRHCRAVAGDEHVLLRRRRLRPSPSRWGPGRWGGGFHNKLPTTLLWLELPSIPISTNVRHVLAKIPGVNLRSPPPKHTYKETWMHSNYRRPYIDSIAPPHQTGGVAAGMGGDGGSRLPGGGRRRRRGRR